MLTVMVTQLLSESVCHSSLMQAVLLSPQCPPVLTLGMAAMAVVAAEGGGERRLRGGRRGDLAVRMEAVEGLHLQWITKIIYSILRLETISQIQLPNIYKQLYSPNFILKRMYLYLLSIVLFKELWAFHSASFSENVDLKINCKQFY